VSLSIYLPFFAYQVILFHDIGILKRIPVESLKQWIPSDSTSTTNTTDQTSTEVSSNLPSVASPPIVSDITNENSFFHEIKEIQTLPQFLYRERSCQLLLILLHQRK
jgi:hypothetical protein